MLVELKEKNRTAVRKALNSGFVVSVVIKASPKKKPNSNVYKTTVTAFIQTANETKNYILANYEAREPLMSFYEAYLDTFNILEKDGMTRFWYSPLVQQSHLTWDKCTTLDFNNNATKGCRSDRYPFMTFYINAEGKATDVKWDRTYFKKCDKAYTESDVEHMVKLVNTEYMKEFLTLSQYPYQTFYRYGVNLHIRFTVGLTKPVHAV